MLFLVLQMFLKLAAKRCMALSCLQALISQFLRLTESKFPGQGGALDTVFCIKAGNHCRCRSDPLSIFYEYVNSNYVASLHIHADSI